MGCAGIFILFSASGSNGGHVYAKITGPEGHYMRDRVDVSLGGGGG